MKLRMIYPKWPKIPEQTPFTLPPLGIIQAAACFPPSFDVRVTDENVEPIDFGEACDVVGISVMLSCQAPRAYEIAGRFRAAGKTVVMGGQHVTMCPDESAAHADAIVVGEGEGSIPRLAEDLVAGVVKPRYERQGFPVIADQPLPRRDLHDKKRNYTFKGWELVDLVQSSRGCSFGCLPCAVGYLEGETQRVRAFDNLLRDVERCSDRIFLVDNSLDQNLGYQRDLFRALAGAGKRFISHPIHPDPETMTLAKKAGWWYVYLAIYRVNDSVRDRIKMYHDHGIGVEGTIMFGVDYHTEDDIKRIVDFLLEIELDLAEFTIMTPFPHSKLWNQLVEEGRIIDRDWSHYDAAHVVFRPAQMTPERLQELYSDAWKVFYREESQIRKMGKLLVGAVDRTKRRRAGSAAPA